MLLLEHSNDKRVMQECYSAAAVNTLQTDIKTALVKQKLELPSDIANQMLYLFCGIITQVSD